MTDHTLSPILLCAGTDPAAAARLAEATVSLLADRPAVVLATWESPLLGPLECVLDELYDARADLRTAARDAAVDTARAAQDVFDAHGIHVTRTICPDESPPWRVILELADKIDAGVIVAGTTERATPHPGALGGQARALAHRSARPLLLVPADVPDCGERAPALVAYDGSPAAGHAVDVAAGLLRPRPAIVATVWHATSALVSAASLVAFPDAVVHKGAAAIDEAARWQAEGQASEGAATMTAAGWSCQHTALDTPHNVPTAIIAAADEHDAAIVVTGTRGRSPISAVVLGSSAESILRHAGRPVLIVAP